MTWIHLHQRSAPWCVRLEGKLKKTVVLDRPGLVISDLYELLEQVSDASKKHVVFLGGLVESIHRDELVVCSGWLNDDRVKRRLVLVSSMIYRGKISENDDDDMMDVRVFRVLVDIERVSRGDSRRQAVCECQAATGCLHPSSCVSDGANLAPHARGSGVVQVLRCGRKRVLHV